MRAAFPHLVSAPPRGASLAVLVAVLAAAVAYEPVHAGLDDPGRHALFILLLAGGWWTTRAVPAFAVALAVIALQVALLGEPAGGPSTASWQRFVEPWASPVMWLFLGGLLLAAAMARNGLDRWLAERLVAPAGTDPRRLLARLMLTAFVFSTVMSNTAATALMLALVQPLLVREDGDERVAAALLLGIPVAANLGGMATLIGTPPNAIAVAELLPAVRIDFGSWLLVGVPPSLLLLGLGFLAVARRLPDRDDTAPADAAPFRIASGGASLGAGGRRVAAVLALTLLAWLTERWHGVPTAVVAVIPVAALSLTGDVTEREVRGLPWDVLVLVAGGLSLGVGVRETGLADWLVGRLVPTGVPSLALAASLAAFGYVMSTFISNTAAATILVPIALALPAAVTDPTAAAALVLPTALVMSTAMALPVSTPPNALVFATGRLDLVALRRLALQLGLVAIPLVTLWGTVAARLLRTG